MLKEKEAEVERLTVRTEEPTREEEATRERVPFIFAFSLDHPRGKPLRQLKTHRSDSPSVFVLLCFLFIYHNIHPWQEAFEFTTKKG